MRACKNYAKLCGKCQIMRNYAESGILCEKLRNLTNYAIPQPPHLNGASGPDRGYIYFSPQLSGMILQQHALARAVVYIRPRALTRRMYIELQHGGPEGPE